MHPPVGVEHRGRLLRVAAVAGARVRAAQEQLAVVGQTRLDRAGSGTPTVPSLTRPGGFMIAIMNSLIPHSSARLSPSAWWNSSVA